MTKRRVVITGMGVVTPMGLDVNTMWNALLNNESGIDYIKSFDTSELKVNIAGEVKNFNPEDYFTAVEAKKIDRVVQFAAVAAKEAYNDAQIEKEKIEAESFGVIIGSGMGGILTFIEQLQVMNEKGPRRVSPMFIPKIIGNMVPGYLSIIYNAKGSNYSVVSACASGSHAIGEAFLKIKYGECDIVMTGGSEAAITPISIAGFSNMKALSTFTGDPKKASKPFDKNRDGFVIAEGAGIIILEELEHAKKRNAKIYAEIVGYGATGDSYHMVAPDEEGIGAAKAMQKAIDMGNVDISEIQYINAHGTSTPANDKIETLAIKKVFGDYAKKLKISSTKSMMGHLLGAAGGVEAIVTVLSIYNSKAHGTLNLNDFDEDCDLDYIPNASIDLEIKYALSNSFGFGGHNCSLLFKKYES